MLSNKITAIYYRTAQTDDVIIEHQMKMLADYKKKHGFDNIAFYVDNGANGITLDHPSMSRLLNDVEDGKISTILVYNLSRLSRNSLESWYVRSKLFPKYGVRFIAMSENYNSDNGDSMLDMWCVIDRIIKA
jgi:DNA invertase Pin-like site-specific DNA recombinase